MEETIIRVHNRGFYEFLMEHIPYIYTEVLEELRQYRSIDFIKYQGAIGIKTNDCFLMCSLPSEYSHLEQGLMEGEISVVEIVNY